MTLVESHVRVKTYNTLASRKNILCAKTVQGFLFVESADLFGFVDLRSKSVKALRLIIKMTSALKHLSLRSLLLLFNPPLFARNLN